MQQTISLQQRTREQQPHPEADRGGAESPSREALEKRYVRYYAPPSGGFFGVTYEQFLQMPVPAVLAVLWFAGMALLCSCVLVLYMLGMSVASVVAGA